MDYVHIPTATIPPANDTPPPEWPDTSSHGWLDTASLLPPALRERIGQALTEARHLHQLATEFGRNHGETLREYASASADPTIPDDVWEILDCTSGYASLWINLLATEGALASMLDVAVPIALSPRRAERPEE
jgi:hypothetical protein